MIQQKKATDDHLVARARKAVANGDKSMLPILEWDARGRVPKQVGTDAHIKAHDVLVELKREYTFKQLADAFDVYESLIYRLVNEKYNQVPAWKAKIIASYSGGEIPSINEEVAWDEYRKAQQKLQKEYKNITYRRLGKKYGLTKGKVAKCINDHYKNPHLEIIEKVL